MIWFSDFLRGKKWNGRKEKKPKKKKKEKKIKGLIKDSKTVVVD